MKVSAKDIGRKWSRRRQSNISVIIHRMSVFLVVMALLAVVALLYLLSDSQKKNIATYERLYSSDIREINKTLTNIRQMIMNEVVYDTDLSKLYFAESDTSSLETLGIEKRLKNSIMNWSAECPYPVYYIFYIPKNGMVVNNCSSSEEYSLWHRIKKEVLEDVGETPGSYEWQVKTFQEKQFLVGAFAVDGKVMISFIELSKLLDSLKKDVYGKSIDVIASDHPENVSLQIDSPIEKTRLNGKITKIWNKIGKSMILSEEVTGVGKVDLTIHIKEGAIKMLFQQVIFLVLLLIIIAITVWYLLHINKTVIQPIINFNENMESLKNDEMYNVNTHYQIKELGSASELISDMVSKIKALKINIYEKTLEHQKTRMDFLMLQIEPHFFINCLNLIYSMAQMNDYESIKMTAKTTSDYLRYMFKNQDTKVRIEDEIYHVERYLQIQKFRYRDGFDAIIEVEEEVRGLSIPPLIIQTFVENAIKHTLTWEEKIEVKIKGYMVNQEDYQAVIEITDTGEGFSKEILDKLYHGVDISEGENRIGVMNAIVRYKAFSGFENYITFQNREEGGALIIIKVPSRPRDEKGDRT